MSVERIKVGDQTPSEGIGERGEGGRLLLHFPTHRRPSSAGSWPEICLHLFKAKDDLLTLTLKEVASDGLTRQIALQLRTYLGPAAVCFSAASIPPTWSHVTRFSIDVLQDSCFRPLRSHFQAQSCTISCLFFHGFSGVVMQSSFENT